MASTIVTKNSSTASAVPLTGDLTQGELAVNVTDKKLYTKDSGGTVVKLVGGLGNQEANAVAITGGSVNGTTIGATTASTGAFTTLSASSTTTLSGGTANGVAYLNGSKVVTTGSALTFDGSKFLISSSGEQLKLLSSGDFSTTGLGYLRFYDSNGARGYLGYGGTADTLSLSSGLSNYLNFATITAASWNINGSEAMRLTSTGLGIGTSSPATRLSVDNTRSDTAGTGWFTYTNAAVTSGKRGMRVDTSNGYCFDYYNGSSWAQQMTLDASGNLLVGATATTNLAKMLVSFTNASNGLYLDETSNSSGTQYVRFSQSGTTTGSITRVLQTSAVNYNTSSDYRLKENVQPMIGAIERVNMLNPVTYDWKESGVSGEGFIAHELAEIMPQAVTGEKDAVDEDGNPVYQGIDTSNLVALLTAAIQEQQALITQLTERITALEGK